MYQDKFEKARKRMVSWQLKGRGIRDAQVLRAMLDVPRHVFVPEKLRHRAYEDNALAIASGQTISQPYMVALMTELLELKPEDTVLEIGTGSGYQTAILARLAESVLSIERHGELADAAGERLDSLGFENITVIVGDGTLGCPDQAPFDAILVTAGAPRVPPSLGGQLVEGGRLVCPVGPRDAQELVRLVRKAQGLQHTRSIQCSFVPLIGDEGWGESVQ